MLCFMYFRAFAHNKPAFHTLSIIIAIQFIYGVQECIVSSSMHSCTPSKNCMAMIWFYILLIDCRRQVYYWKIKGEKGCVFHLICSVGKLVFCLPEQDIQHPCNTNLYDQPIPPIYYPTSNVNNIQHSMFIPYMVSFSYVAGFLRERYISYFFKR